jgi:hypothetical protein
VTSTEETRMSTQERHVIAVEDTHWPIPGAFETVG